jgi:hypothetical protein
VQTTEQLPPGDRLSADHPMPHNGPIDSPGAWYGSDLQYRSEWKYVLSEQERTEMLVAMRAAHQRKHSEYWEEGLCSSDICQNNP